MKEKITLEIDIPEGITVTMDGNVVTVKGEKGEVVKKLHAPQVTITVKDNKFTINCEKATKREAKNMYTIQAHFKNMIKGAQEGFVYKLKICSGHFPMTCAVSGTDFTIKNFLGEKHPRKVKLPEGATVKINGDEIVVESPNKELAGQAAATIEQATKVRGRDLRIFQDGIYIIEKAGKSLGA